MEIMHVETSQGQSAVAGDPWRRSPASLPQQGGVPRTEEAPAGGADSIVSVHTGHLSGILRFQRLQEVGRRHEVEPVVPLANWWPIHSVWTSGVQGVSHGIRTSGRVVIRDLLVQVSNQGLSGRRPSLR